MLFGMANSVNDNHDNLRNLFDYVLREFCLPSSENEEGRLPWWRRRKSDLMERCEEIGAYCRGYSINDVSIK